MTLKQDAQAIFNAGLVAVDPATAVRRFLRRQEQQLILGEETLVKRPPGRTVVIAFGKAAGAMAAQTENILGDLIDDGLVVTKDGHGVPLQSLPLLETGHPLPDRRGEKAAQRVVEMLQGLQPNDLVLCLISGGGSALLPCPVDGVTLEEKMQLTDQLLACGANITEINSVRKHLSRLKGGRLARLAAPAQVRSLILSDIVGDPLDMIASGPTAADRGTFADALSVLARYGLTDSAPQAILHYLQRGAKGLEDETPKELNNVRNLLIGTNRMAVEAAAVEAKKRGYQPLVLSTTITGETRDIAAMHVALLREIEQSGQPICPPACLLSGGETTVTLNDNHGKGGRNQEFSLAAALDMKGMAGAAVLCGGTDGTDGPTDAAGAFADGSTVERAAACHYTADKHLREHDAYPLFAALDDLLMTGPTGTNVMDLRIALLRNQDR